MTAPISALTWAYNEQDRLEGALTELKPYVDEIIVIDTDSTDNTMEIANAHATKVIKKPRLLCGDMYKETLANEAKNDWLLWFYADERWPKKTLETFKTLVEKEKKYNCFAFMRHEFLDDIRVQWQEGSITKFHGTLEHPNYQNRLNNKAEGLYYTELVHAEVFGNVKVCPMPPEYYFEHRKSRIGQEFDNLRTYVWMKHLIWKYEGCEIEPYKTYVNSYKRIVRETLDSRKEHIAEQEWWKWREHWVAEEAIPELKGTA